MAHQTRDYQERDKEELRRLLRAGARRILFEASVGYGKSVVIEQVAHGYAGAGHHVLVLSNRTAVVDQLRARAAGNERIIASTVQGIVRRLDRIPTPRLIMVDEAHMGGAADQYRLVYDASPDAIVIGYTGTPTPELYDLLPAVVTGESAAALTVAGWLAPLRYHVPQRLDLSRIPLVAGDYDQEQLREELERREICGSAIRSYRELCAGRPALLFAINVRHARSIAEEFRAAGIAAEVLTGADKVDEVSRKLAWLRAGGLVIAVDKVSAGFDLPDLAAILSLRPTKSAQLWVQQLGRVARAAPGKAAGLVIDHADNTMRLGALTEERDWRAADRISPERQTDDGERLSVRRCPACLFIFAAGPTACPACGADCGKDLRISKREAIELRERAAAEIEEERRRAGLARRKEQGQKQTLADLIALGTERGYANPRGWAWSVYSKRSPGRRGAPRDAQPPAC
jgi:superfamily II DNA or RNA helicase